MLLHSAKCIRWQQTITVLLISLHTTCRVLYALRAAVGVNFLNGLIVVICNVVILSLGNHVNISCSFLRAVLNERIFTQPRSKCTTVYNSVRTTTGQHM